MKTLMIALLLLVSYTICLAQYPDSLGEGSVVFALSIPDGTFVDFNLCCGSSGDHYGFLEPGFTFRNAAHHGRFKLYVPATYLGRTLWCPESCKYEGNFVTWHGAIKIDQYCHEDIGTLMGTYTTDKRTWNDAPAEYSQTWCGSDEQGWVAGGDLTVELSQ
jgi:hypothetical protein